MINKSYFIKRTIIMLITIFFVIILNFILFRLLPGNPITLLYRSPALTSKQIAMLYSQFGLNKPLWYQLIIYIENSYIGNFGISFYWKAPVISVIIPAIENSLILLLPANLIAILLGIITGVISAWHNGTKLDGAILGISLAFYAMPTFWLGSMLIVVAIYIGGIPVGGMYSISFLGENLLMRFVDFLGHLALPLITLTLVLYGEFTIIMRNSLLDVLSEDYIVTAKSKGANNNRILWKHALPNGLLPLISLIAISFGLIIGGAMFTEIIFSWPGIGYITYLAIFTRDYPVLQGAFFFVAITVVLANYIADFIYGYVDPRVRYE
ncbi:MAG: ABC transporter permease [Thermoplasmata archaeon]